MAFNITNVKTSGKQVKWKFETLENVYTSDVERFRRNVQFWMKKLNLAADTQVELLEGAQWLQDHMAEEKNIVDVDHEIVEEATMPQPEESLLVELTEEFNELIETLEDDTITDSPAVEPSGDELDAQPSVAEPAKDTVDTPKPKSRKKTA